MTAKTTSLSLNDAEALRYNRQILLRGFDFNGQEHLKASHVLIVGLGGLGCAASQYLNAAGIGTMTLLDYDYVSISNLQRQILHNDTRLGMSKVTSAQATLQQLNPYTQIHLIHGQLTDQELTIVIKQVDIVLDCTDNLTIRERLNQLCFSQRTPLVSGAAIRMEGQLSLFTYHADEPCYHCLGHMIDQDTLSCAETGVMSPLVGIIGATQAMESIKLLTGYGTIPRGRLMLYDALSSQWHTLQLPRDPLCKVCSSSYATR